jgi:uncharacterized protein YndB with AHSA1/START domain
MVPDRIEQEVLIDAPLEVVWKVVTEPEHVAGWFSDEAVIDLRPGGEATLTWHEHGTFRGRVERVEPPSLVAFTWARPAGEEPRADNSTLVEFTLSEEDGRTRLRVVESGFRKLHGTDEEKAKYAEGNTEGWRQELGELVVYAATLVQESATR